jgi:hypothetical protein
VDNLCIRCTLGLGQFRLQFDEAIENSRTGVQLAYAHTQRRLGHTADRLLHNLAESSG